MIFLKETRTNFIAKFICGLTKVVILPVHKKKESVKNSSPSLKNSAASARLTKLLQFENKLDCTFGRVDGSEILEEFLKNSKGVKPSRFPVGFEEQKTGVC